MVNDTLAQIKEEGYVEKVIREKLEYTIQNIIDSLLSSYSKFGRSLEKQIEELDYDEVAEVTVIVKDNDSILKHIYINPEEDKAWYRCKYKISLDAKDNTVLSVLIGDQEFDNKTIMGGLYGPDQMLFKMWTRQSKLIIDDYETVFYNLEYHD